MIEEIELAGTIAVALEHVESLYETFKDKVEPEICAKLKELKADIIALNNKCKTSETTEKKEHHASHVDAM